MRRSRFFNGANSGRRLKPTCVTTTGELFAVTTKAEAAGRFNAKFAPTKFQFVGAVFTALVLISVNSNNVGERTRSSCAPTAGMAAGLDEEYCALEELPNAQLS